jgi:hypothetical protein
MLGDLDYSRYTYVQVPTQDWYELDEMLNDPYILNIHRRRKQFIRSKGITIKTSDGNPKLERFLNEEVVNFVLDTAMMRYKMAGYVIWNIYKDGDVTKMREADMGILQLWRIRDKASGFVEYRAGEAADRLMPEAAGNSDSNDKKPIYHLTMIDEPNEFGEHTSIFARCFDRYMLAQLFIEVALRGDIYRISPVNFLQEKRDSSRHDNQTFEDTITNIMSQARDMRKKVKRTKRDLLGAVRKYAEIHRTAAQGLDHRPNSMKRDDDKPSAPTMGPQLVDIDEENKEIVKGAVAESRSNVGELADVRDYTISLIMNEPLEMIKPGQGKNTTDGSIMKDTQKVGIREDKELFIRMMTLIYNELLDIKEFGGSVKEEGGDGSGAKVDKGKGKMSPSDSEHIDIFGAGQKKLSIVFEPMMEVSQEILDNLYERHVLSIEDYAKLSCISAGIDERYITIDKKLIEKDEKLLYQPLDMQAKGLLNPAGAGKPSAAKRPSSGGKTAPSKKKKASASAGSSNPKK